MHNTFRINKIKFITSFNFQHLIINFLAFFSSYSFSLFAYEINQEKTIQIVFALSFFRINISFPSNCSQITPCVFAACLAACPLQHSAVQGLHWYLSVISWQFITELKSFLPPTPPFPLLQELVMNRMGNPQQAYQLTAGCDCGLNLSRNQAASVELRGFCFIQTDQPWFNYCMTMSLYHLGYLLHSTTHEKIIRVFFLYSKIFSFLIHLHISPF